MKFSTTRKRKMLAEPGGDVCCLAEYGLCLLEGEPMTMATRDDRYATFEHLIPKKRGGTDATSNVRLSHKACNDARGTARLPIEPPPAPYIPTGDPSTLMPFTMEWLRWKGYATDD